MSVTAASGVVQLDEFRWMLPRQGGMRVPGILFADRPLLEKMLSDRTLDQVRNAAHLPGILEASIAMPDAHWGYGLPVGGVVATDEHEGVVSPGAVGYDIGCGVRLLRSPLTRAELEPHLDALADALYREVPCGVGQGAWARPARCGCTAPSSIACCVTGRSGRWRAGAASRATSTTARSAAPWPTPIPGR